MKRHGSLIGTVLAALACALLIGLWLHCGSAAPEARGPSAPAEPAPPASSASSPQTATALAPAEDAAAPAQSGRTTMDKLVGEHGESDLRLLAQIEKATGKSPPPEVYVVLKMARDGASDEALRAHIQSSFSGQILVRKQLMEWLGRRQSPKPSSAPPEPASSGPRRVDAFKKSPAPAGR